MPSLKVTRIQLAILLTLSMSFLAACNRSGTEDHRPVDSGQHILTLYDFTDNEIPADVVLSNAAAQLTEQGSTTGTRALNVKMQSAANSSAGVSFSPPTPWDWSEHEDFSLAMDIANYGEVSTQLWVDVSDIDGRTSTRSIVVPVGDAKTYYFKIDGHDLGSPNADSSVELNFESGLRSNPATWESDDVLAISMWGTKNLNTSGITRIVLGVRGTLRDKEITLDNVRLFANPAMDETFLEGIVDEYGQNAKAEFNGKIHSDEELHAQRDAEYELLLAGNEMPDRSKFNGWTGGPKLEGTGYFRTEKIGDKWSLVDPEGYPYFATGLDIIRLSNSTTMTGYDFDPGRIKQRAADDLTPEDSMGLNPVGAEAIPTRHLVSELRGKMFNWLPAYDEPLGNHYGYRRESHSGPLEHGEVFSFYSANLERKYGEDTPWSFLDEWENVTIDRMLNWGFTSLGNWTDPRFYDQEKIPFFANGWIIGDFKTVSSGNDFWAALPDPFDPVFEERAMATVKAVSEEVAGTPWCVGVFIDNEKSWGRSETVESQLGIVINTLTRDGSDVPTKRAFTNLMREKYDSIDALNEVWTTDIADWDAFDAGIDSTLRTDAQRQDYSAMLRVFANEYFAIVEKAMDTYMPNHLYLGARFADWGMPMEVVRASADHVDVISFNRYKEGLPEHEWTFLDEFDMPTIIGEFHFGASDSGLFHPGLLIAADQEDRARMYYEYMMSVVDNPYFVGAHWFQYIDSPITGRAIDGENYNVGFVSVTDVPYQPMVEAAKKLHAQMYERRFGE